MKLFQEGRSGVAHVTDGPKLRPVCNARPAGGNWVDESRLASGQATLCRRCASTLVSGRKHHGMAHGPLRDKLLAYEVARERAWATRPCKDCSRVPEATCSSLGRCVTYDLHVECATLEALNPASQMVQALKAEMEAVRGASFRTLRDPARFAHEYHAEWYKDPAAAPQQPAAPHAAAPRRSGHPGCTLLALAAALAAMGADCPPERKSACGRRGCAACWAEWLPRAAEAELDDLLLYAMDGYDVVPTSPVERNCREGRANVAAFDPREVFADPALRWHWPVPRSEGGVS